MTTDWKSKSTRRRRMTKAESDAALWFKYVVTQRGCQVHADRSECDGPIQAAHVLSQQQLRRHGFADLTWDPRNGIGACYRAHRRSDGAVERFPLSTLSSEFWEFADELDLRWLAERIYG